MRDQASEPTFLPAYEPTVSSSTSSPPDLIALGGKPPLRRYLRDIWERRQFAIASAFGELRSQHMDTTLGNVWHLLNPMLLIGVYYLVFDVILNFTRGIENLIGFLAIGVASYQWSQKSITSGAKSISGNEGLIRSLQFPRALLPIGVTIKETLAFFPAVGLMIVVVLVTGEGVTPQWALVVPIFLLQAMFNLGAALFLARVADKFRDTINLLPFVFRLVFYASGVIYAVDNRLEGVFEDHPWVAEAFVINPFYSQLSLWREALMTTQEIQFVGRMWLSVSIWAVAALVLGFLVFRGGEKDFGRG